MTKRRPNCLTHPQAALLNDSRTATQDQRATGGDVKVRFDKLGHPLYCDTGLCEGDISIDLVV